MPSNEEELDRVRQESGELREAMRQQLADEQRRTLGAERKADDLQRKFDEERQRAADLEVELKRLRTQLQSLDAEGP